jgi:hypothetical protein
MNDLRQKASELRSALPKTGGGTAPIDQGVRLATFPRPEGELRLSWNVYEDRPYLRFQLWSKSDDGSFWPVKARDSRSRSRNFPTSRKAFPMPSTWPWRRRDRPGDQITPAEPMRGAEPHSEYARYKKEGDPMQHEVRHLAVCTCGRSIEIIIRAPRTEEKPRGKPEGLSSPGGKKR